MEENLKDLRKEVYHIMSEEEVPEDIKKILSEIYQKLNNLLNKIGIEDKNISGYLAGNNMILEKGVEATLKNNREIKIQEVLHQLDKLEIFKENAINKEKTEEIDKENLAKSVNNSKLNKGSTERIIGVVDDSIKNSRNTIMRYLSNNRAKKDFLERLDEDIYNVKKYAKSKENEIMKALEQQNEDTLSKIFEAYYVIKERPKRNAHKKFAQKYGYHIDNEVEQAIIRENKAEADKPPKSYEKGLPHDVII